MAPDRGDDPCRQRKTRGIAEAVGRPVHYLRHHGQRLYRARADARREQECRKILWAALSGGGEGGVKALREHVAWPHIVVSRHDKMRQQRLLRRLGTAETAELVHDAVGAERCQGVELRRPGGGGAAVRQVTISPCTGPSMALWGASTSALRNASDSGGPGLFRRSLHHRPFPVVGETKP
jgi:hypothetical protein